MKSLILKSLFWSSVLNLSSAYGEDRFINYRCITNNNSDEVAVIDVFWRGASDHIPSQGEVSLRFSTTEFSGGHEKVVRYEDLKSDYSEKPNDVPLISGNFSDSVSYKFYWYFKEPTPKMSVGRIYVYDKTSIYKNKNIIVNCFQLRDF